MPDQTAVDLKALSDLKTPWCIRVAATLRIAESMDAGVSDVNELAAASGCDVRSLRGMLNHLVDKGVFIESERGHFALNDAARELLSPAVHVGLDLDGIGSRMAGGWSTLLSYVRTGAPAYHERFGLPFWEDLEAHPTVAASFDDLMGAAGHGVPDGEFPIAGGWSAVRTVVDVGGGTGSLLAQILRARPAVRGILIDLPQAVVRSAPTFQAAGVSDRVTAIGQSFFDPLPAGADLYLLRSVLHDWEDGEAIAILSRCAEAARPAGRVILLKSIRAEDNRDTLEIAMLLVGGRTRSLAEIKELARRAGLEVSAVVQERAGHAVVECRPA